MASRRNRIRGIANIPQRRKNNGPIEEETEAKLPILQNDIQSNAAKEIELHVNKDKDHLEVNLNNINQTLSHNNGASNQISGIGHLKDVHIKADISRNTEEVLILNDVGFISEHEEHVEEAANNLETSGSSAVLVNVGNESKKKNICITEDTVIKSSSANKQLVRRKFIKPLVSVATVNRKSDIITNNVGESTEAKEAISNINSTTKIVVVDCVVLPLVDTESQKNEVEKSCLNSEQEHSVTLNETNLLSNKVVSSVESTIKSQHSVKNLCHNSDTEYPPPPPSPSKINRSRIKAIPRLSQRKTSFSASESEDESRRFHNRNRNDSVCSVASVIPESVSDCMSPQRPQKEFNSVIQKKCNRTEQSRKLAEARREFQRRFGANNPDKQKLKMIDLIFYNPSTNPMSEKKPKKEEGCQQVQVPTSESLEEKVEKDSQEVDKNSDEENDMPVPQIKISPSGEIILDEKSLVIENKEVNKQKEEMQKSELVDGDFDTGYGIYKKVKRTKDWCKQETLRFYKALNMIGTDFSLMAEIFPRRTRRELKMKFKKEEKVNKHLVDKALMQPCGFDYVELKHEADMEEKEMAEIERIKQETKKLKRENNGEGITKKRRAHEQGHVIAKRLKPHIKLKSSKVKPLTINSVLEDSDADESDINTQSDSDSDEEVTLPLKPTRSGRVPKTTKKYNELEPRELAEVMKRNKLLKQDENSDVVPGSVMILAEQGSEGEPVYKIYMVTPEKKLTPLDLDPETITNIVRSKQNDEKNEVLKENNVTLAEEQNITIPADENVTTLKNISTTNDIDSKRATGTLKTEKNEILHKNKNNETLIEEQNSSLPTDERVTILNKIHEKKLTAKDSDPETILVRTNSNARLLDSLVTLVKKECKTISAHKNVNAIKENQPTSQDTKSHEVAKDILETILPAKIRDKKLRISKNDEFHEAGKS